MKGLNYDELVKESVQELGVLYCQQSRALSRRRLQFLLLLKSGKCFSQAKAGGLIGLGTTTLSYVLVFGDEIEKTGDVPADQKPAKSDVFQGYKRKIPCSST